MTNAQQNLRSTAKEIVVNHFEDWLARDRVGHLGHLHKRISYDDLQKLASLSWLAADRLDNYCPLTDLDEKSSVEISILLAKVAGGDTDVKDELFSMLEGNCVEYYTQSIERLLCELYDEHKESENLTMSLYDRGMHESGHNERDFR